jgi:hypothetical protein
VPISPGQTALVIFTGVETVAVTNFSSTITLGSVILGVLVLVVAGFFTVRANIAKVWHENYDAEVVRRKQAEERCQELLNEMHRERDEQAKLRHDLKGELTAVSLALEAEKLKPNLGVIVEMATEHYASAMRDVTAMFEGVTETQRQMQEALARIADQLEKNGKEPV